MKIEVADMSILLYESIYDELDTHLMALARRLAPGRYEDALAEAAKIAKEKGIPMTVEALKPVHFGWTEYKLPVGDTILRLRENVRFYPVGIFSTDEDFTELEWWNGAKIEYIATWPTYHVPFTKEKSATMTPQPRFANTFTITVTSRTPKPKVDAWIAGYVVLPQTMREMKVTR
jgi:hypothetical protein